MASTATRVREAGIGEVAQLSATLADAFTTEPILQWMIPSLRRDTRMRPAARQVGDDGAALGGDRLVRVFGMRLPPASRAQVFFQRNHLQEPHYYIRFVGVATRFQGQGLGTALLRPTLDRCDRERTPAAA